MQVNEALNKAIDEIEAQFKSAGITGVKLDWWSNNDAPDVFITFPNDVDADGKPFINKNYDYSIWLYTNEGYKAYNIIDDKITEEKELTLGEDFEINYRNNYN